jgi:hypothetical protein
MSWRIAFAICKRRISAIFKKSAGIFRRKPDIVMIGRLPNAMRESAWNELFGGLKSGIWIQEPGIRMELEAELFPKLQFKAMVVFSRRQPKAKMEEICRLYVEEIKELEPRFIEQQPFLWL